MSVASAVCRQEEVPATDRSLDQRSPTDCGVSEYDLDTSTMRRASPVRAVEPWNKKLVAVGLPCVLCRGERNIRRMAICSFRIAL